MSHNRKWIRDDFAGWKAAISRRPLSDDQIKLLDEIKLQDAACLELTTKIQNTESDLKKTAQRIGDMIRAGQDAGGLKRQVKADNASQNLVRAYQESLLLRLKELVYELPNIPSADVPEGTDENANVVVSTWHPDGPSAKCEVAPKDHAELGKPFGLDFDGGVRTSGSRFAALRGDMALLERALAWFMMGRHTRTHGYQEVAPPLLVKEECVLGTGQLPKFEEDLFRTTSGMYLIPTAEVSLTNLYRDQIVDFSEGPIRMVADTPCFRAEAGSAGRDTHGLIRMHQFRKVELVSICHPNWAEKEHLRMLSTAEAILQSLKLPYRTVLLCTGDMGFSACKTYDIEVWMPSQGKYREISSVSNCGDFQARRMNTRFKTPGVKGTNFVHTLNGSGVAIGRAMAAIIENYQRADGTIKVPDVLTGVMGFEIFQGK